MTEKELERFLKKHKNEVDRIVKNFENHINKSDEALRKVLSRL
jgi:uncharacterized membrane-anchored protein YhcB (DUF1043 family)